MCYKNLDGEVSLTSMRGHNYKLYKQQSSVNACKYFSVTEFTTFGMFYVIMCLKCRLQVTLEDCLIKSISHLQCCYDSILCVGHI